MRRTELLQVIFPTNTVIKYFKDQNLDAFKSKERLHVAVTRARFSATFVE